MIESIGKFIFSVGLVISTMLGYTYEVPKEQSFGSSFTPVQGTNYTLSGAGISSTATSITLTSFTLPDPARTPVTMSMFGDVGYAVLEPQTNKVEVISFTNVVQNSNGTATLTGVTRGINFVTPYDASSSRALSHSGGSYLILSNPAVFYAQQFLFKNQIGTSTSVMIFSSTTPPRYDSIGVQASGTYIATTSEFASVAYVNAVSAAGCTVATSAITGCSRLATQLQTASSTFSSITPTVLTTQYSTSSPYTAGLWIPSTQNDGKLNANFIGTSTNYTYNFAGPMSFASTSFSATTTIAASSLTNGAFKLNGLPYVFPSSRGASGSFLSENGSGTLTWSTSIPRYSYSTTTPNITAVTNAYSTSTANFAIPTINASSTIQFKGNFTCDNSSNGDQGCQVFLRTSTGTNIATVSVTSDQAAAPTYGFDVMISKDISSTNWNAIGTAINYGPFNGLTSSGGVAVNTQSSVDLSSGATLQVVVRVPGANTSVTLTNYVIVVNP